jgi:hypothetical protein
MACSENGNFNPPALEERIWADEQRTSLLLRERRKRGIESVFTAGAHDQNLLPDSVCRQLQVSRIDFDVWIVGVHKYADQSNPRYQLAQQFQSFRNQCIGELSHACDVATRPT